MAGVPVAEGAEMSWPLWIAGLDVRPPCSCGIGGIVGFGVAVGNGVGDCSRMAGAIGVAEVVGDAFGKLQETMKMPNPTNTITLPMMPPFMPVGIVELAQEWIRPQRRQRISMFPEIHSDEDAVAA